MNLACKFNDRIIYSMDTKNKMIMALRQNVITVISLLLISSIVYAQENENDRKYVNNTFSGTRLINGHSVETKYKGTLEFLITHRFGNINTGIYNFFGLDQANIRLGLEYALFDNLTIGVGRSSFEKTYDGFVKWKFMRQKKGFKNIPVNMTFFTSMAINTLKPVSEGEEIPFARRLDYATLVLISRKFNDRLSIQLMPVWIHRNYVIGSDNVNELLAIGMGGRYKITGKVAITGEYYPRLNGLDIEEYHNSLSFGVDLETGGHVFQLIFTNARPMIEKGFIGETTGSWADGDIRFGFNISRIFQLGSSQYADWE